MIIIPLTQLQLILSMVIAEIMLLSEPHYTVKIGSESYFSLAVGAFVAGIFVFTLLAIKLRGGVQFMEGKLTPKVLVKN